MFLLTTQQIYHLYTTKNYHKNLLYTISKEYLATWWISAVSTKIKSCQYALTRTLHNEQPIHQLNSLSPWFIYKLLNKIPTNQITYTAVQNQKTNLVMILVCYCYLCIYNSHTLGFNHSPFKEIITMKKSTHQLLMIPSNAQSNILKISLLSYPFKIASILIHHDVVSGPNLGVNHRWHIY